MDMAKQDAATADAPLGRKNRPAPDGLHDKSYQDGGARGAERGDGLNGDECTGKGDSQDIGAGAD